MPKHPPSKTDRQESVAPPGVESPFHCPVIAEDGAGLLQKIAAPYRLRLRAKGHP